MNTIATTSLVCAEDFVADKSDSSVTDPGAPANPGKASLTDR